MAVPIQLAPGEQCYAQGVGQIFVFQEGDPSYVHKSAFGFGLTGLAMVAGTAIGNSNRRARAEREAAPAFRPADYGPLYVTDQRFAIQGQRQWIDLWYHNVRMTSCDGSGILFRMADLPPMQVEVWPVDYFFALFHFLANGNVIQIPDDPPSRPGGRPSRR
jgi:hypothetical protein